MNEWMVKTHHLIQQMRKLRPRGRKGPVQSQGWKPRMSTYSICLSPQLFDLRKDRYGSWELAPFDNDFNDGSDAFLFIYLIWLSDNFSGFPSPTQIILPPHSIFPTPGHSPLSCSTCLSFQIPLTGALWALPHSTRLSSSGVPHPPHGFSSYFRMGAYHSAL